MVAQLRARADATPAWVGMLIVIGFWGSSTLLSVAALREIGPMATAFWRWLLALPVLWGAVYATGQTAPAWQALRRWPLQLFFLGAMGISLFYTMQNLALRRTSAFNVGLLISLTPIFIAVLAALWLREPLRRLTVLGISLGFGGVVLLTMNGGASAGVTSWSGDLLAVASALVGAVFTVYGKGLSARMSPLVMLTLAATLGLVQLLPFVIAEAQWQPQTLNAWLCLLALGLGAAAFANVWWFRILQTTTAARAGVLLFAIALISALLAVAVLGDPLTLGLMAGAGLILASVRIVQSG